MSLDTKHWQLDRKVNLSHLVTTIGLVVAVFTWGNTVETRIETSVVRINQVAKDIVRLEKEQERNRQEIRDDLRIINAKLDTLLADKR